MSNIRSLIEGYMNGNAWEDLCVLAREDDIAAEVCNQELTVSWA